LVQTKKNHLMQQLFINIKEIFGTHDAFTDRVQGQNMDNMPSIKQAYLFVKDGLIADFGSMNELPDYYKENSNIVNLELKSVLPTYCDSHTHIVFAEPRSNEFLMKIKGKSYEEIAAAGGGILNSASKLQQMSEDELFERASFRLDKIVKMGTGAIEIKSGYGLTIESEIKMLRVIQRLKNQFPVSIKSTLLAAHALPKEYANRSKDYINEVAIPLIDQTFDEQLADFIDVFVERNFFSVEDGDLLLHYAIKKGLKPKIHVNQLSRMGGVALGVKHQAVSVDHLEEFDDEDLHLLKDSKTIGTILPSCSFFLKIPYAPARMMIDHGLGIALASDYNPGSTPSGNMNFVQSLACIYQKMTPNEAMNAVTINGAYAMELSDSLGSISKGKKAHFIVTEPIQGLAEIAYSFGRPVIDSVYLNGIKY
jgi:imidazolonepropionase